MSTSIILDTDMSKSRSGSATKSRAKSASGSRDKRGTMSVLERRVEAFKREFLLAALKDANWSPSETAKMLEMSGGSATVLRLIKSLDLQEIYDEHRPPPGRRPKA